MTCERVIISKISSRMIFEPATPYSIRNHSLIEFCLSLETRFRCLRFMDMLYMYDQPRLAHFVCIGKRLLEDACRYTRPNFSEFTEDELYGENFRHDYCMYHTNHVYLGLLHASKQAYCESLLFSTAATSSQP